jgi:hypothetical protein
MEPNQFEGDKLLAMRAKHPDWIWNRADTHVILGLPTCLEAFKTPVEPGNSFSPGPGTYGVSSWLCVGGALHAPEEKPLSELRWKLQGGGEPVLCAEFQAGPLAVRSRLMTHGDVERSDIWNLLSIEVENPSRERVRATLYLVLRSFGAAGGPLKSLGLRDGVVLVNGAPLVFPEQAPARFGAVSYAENAEDISLWLRRGAFPSSTEVEDPSTWASGALEYALDLGPGERVTRNFAFHLHAGHWMLKSLAAEKPPRFAAVSAQAERAERAAVLPPWPDQIPVRLELPDPRFSQAFFAQLAHLYMFTVDSAPRITPISYPIWWLRDGAYVVNALDKGGLHPWVKKACLDVKGRDAFGGFGSEGDGPGESIWMLSEHYLLTRDEAYLKTRGAPDQAVRRMHDPEVPARAEPGRAVRGGERWPDSGTHGSPFPFVLGEWVCAPRSAAHGSLCACPGARRSRVRRGSGPLESGARTARRLELRQERSRRHFRALADGMGEPERRADHVPLRRFLDPGAGTRRPVQA